VIAVRYRQNNNSTGAGRRNVTAFIGYCFDEGACFAADAQRNHLDTQSTSQVKKIVELTPEIVIATGGLGTIGHNARDEVRDSVETGAVDTTSLKPILSEIQQVFSRAYEESFERDPGHDIPLYALLAGRRPSDGTGFICALKSNDEFEPYFVEEAGRPYFTGSDTELVRELSSEVYHRLKAEFSVFPFDIWATASIQAAANQHPEIGLPVQLTRTDSKGITDRYPISEVITDSDTRFQLEWDGSSRR
jgi:hypothetical protein